MTLVGITGRAGSGKSLIAITLVTLADYDVISFATPLKDMASRLLIDNYRYSQAEVDVFMAQKEIRLPGLGISMRHLLQTLGTEWGRNLISPFIWTNIAAVKISEQLDWSSVVVDDLRFESEATLIRNFGGLVIHLTRPGTYLAGSHVSEAGIAVQPGDVVIANEGTIGELIEAVSRAIARFESGADELLELCSTPCWSYRA